jgi:hypothetical protein
MNACPIFLAALLTVSAYAKTDPWRTEADRLSRRKEEIIEILRHDFKGETLIAVKSRKRNKLSLRVYRLERSKARLLFMEPGFGKEIEFASIHEKGKIPDLAGDGSRIIAYRTEHTSLKQKTLVLLRYADGALTRLKDVPEGEFMSLSGGISVVETSRPLGRFFNVTCEETFRSPAESAHRTRIYGWEKGELTVTSLRHKKYLLKKIAGIESRVSGVNVRTTERYADYLGDALSIFFLHEELGEKQKGWSRFLELFPLQRSDPPVVKKCFEKLRSELQEALDVGPDESAP